MSRKRSRQYYQAVSLPLDFLSSKQKKRKTKPRLHFKNVQSASAKYRYDELTFEDRRNFLYKTNLIFPCGVLQILFSYFGIHELYIVRKDNLFKDIIDAQSNRNPNYIHEVFIASTKINNLLTTIKWDSKWFLMTILPHLKHNNIFYVLTNYVNDHVNNNRSNLRHDYDENKLKKTVQINHINVTSYILDLIIEKLYFYDSSYAVMQRCKDLCLPELEMYHKKRVILKY